MGRSWASVMSSDDGEALSLLGSSLQYGCNQGCQVFTELVALEFLYKEDRCNLAGVAGMVGGWEAGSGRWPAAGVAGRQASSGGNGHGMPLADYTTAAAGGGGVASFLSSYRNCSFGHIHSSPSAL
uniref:Uncharacterized protein n=1 Tax=Oryza nivara TaxID=4536 RepID=A0A0E0GW42_ORYNI